MAPPTVTPASACVAVRNVVGGAGRRATVVSAARAAVYLALDGSPPHVVAVEAPGGLRLPNAVTVGRWDVSLLGRPGSAAVVGNDTVAVGSQVFRVTRWWRSAPALGVVDPARLTSGLAGMATLLQGTEPGVPGHLVDQLGDALVAVDAEATVGAAADLLGRGPGSTPSGDDVLGGAVAALRLLAGDHPTVTRVTAAVDHFVRRRAGATTPLSASLLLHACRGEVGQAAGRVLLAVVGHAPLPPAVRRLLGVGGHSGVDVAHGVRAGATAALAVLDGPGSRS